MSHRDILSDEQWERLAPLVERLRRRGPRSANDRIFVEAVIWVVRTGAPWRDLPRSFGKWSSVYRRFRRWAVAGRWDALLRLLAPSGEGHRLLLIDSTIVKAHPHAAGARKKGVVKAARRWGARAVVSRRRSTPSSPIEERWCATC